MRKEIFILGIINIILINNALAQDSTYIFIYPSAKDIDVSVECNLYEYDECLTYDYTISSGLTSEQDVWTFRVDYTGDTTDSLESPEGWSVLKPKDTSIISWGAKDTSAFIRPGHQLGGFRIVSHELPMVGTYYVQGYFPTPVVESEPDSVIGGSFYENSKKGQTLVPMNDTDPFMPFTFLDRICTYQQQAYDLGWISNQGVFNSLRVKLNNAKEQLEKGQIHTVSNLLNAYINELDAQKEKHLTDEAYGLLKFNSEYLVEKLSE